MSSVIAANKFENITLYELGHKVSGQTRYTMILVPEYGRIGKFDHFTHKEIPTLKSNHNKVTQCDLDIEQTTYTSKFSLHIGKN
jgi:hypothetical protein